MFQGSIAYDYDYEVIWDLIEFIGNSTYFIVSVAHIFQKIKTATSH